MDSIKREYEKVFHKVQDAKVEYERAKAEYDKYEAKHQVPPMELLDKLEECNAIIGVYGQDLKRLKKLMAL